MIDLDDMAYKGASEVARSLEFRLREDLIRAFHRFGWELLDELFPRGMLKSIEERAEAILGERDDDILIG